ncbi:MAG: short-chain dehydrogenase/reductase [Steroidobacteraceae bacterium]|jgi:short-subunit dehydrogenase|nr:short-chain dehydrogenase/reductase [Steroidobacteraceae bacterium]
MQSTRPLAVVTGASSGIGLHLALEAASHGYDLILAADEPLEAAADAVRALGAQVDSLVADLSKAEGVDALYARTQGRTVEALLANAGRGLGKGFLDQDFEEVQHVIDTNITGTVDLIQRVARDMRRAGRGKILITGSIAGFMPGTFQAVYNGSKAFLDSFSYALRNELRDSGVTVTCLMPGPTDTEFFERADLLDTKVGADDHKADPAEVARVGFEAMQKGEGGVVAGLGNKLRVALAGVLPNAMLAEQHRKMAEPGSARN